ncbi:hypothetical protein [Sediminispirochaeta bajacaliforniensis]|uniref:hypothetical protein n=1 Tax=Sediminispirochaeta bajacaliforniensis TaxID=148 RepID=UPI00037B4A05|nr:hypothetical protein [Sediminispirochaeta bajacaliforniensis]
MRSFFPSVTFLTHLEKVTQVDWIEFIEGMTQIGQTTTYRGHINNKTVYIEEYERTQTLAALRNHEAAPRGTTYAENMNMVLDNIRSFLYDPDVDDIEEITFTSTYRPDNAYSHGSALAMDLSGRNFTFSNNSNLPFDREAALRYANVLGRYEVKSILFNCQYVRDNVDKKNVFGLKQHEHHFHVDFGVESFSNDTQRFNCWGSYVPFGATVEKGERRYRCINHANCTYKNKRK